MAMSPRKKMAMGKSADGKSKPAVKLKCGGAVKKMRDGGAVSESSGSKKKRAPRPRPDPDSAIVRAFNQNMTASRYFGLDEEGNSTRGPRGQIRPTPRPSAEESGESRNTGSRGRGRRRMRMGGMVKK